MLDNTQARTLLERSLFSYLFEILWRSVLLTSSLVLSDYLFRPKAFEFDFEIVLITFVVIAVLFSFIAFFGLLMASARYRKRSSEKDEG